MIRQSVLLGFLFLLKFGGCLAEETTIGDYAESDYIDNSIDLIPTYRSPLEKFLQKISRIDNEVQSHIDHLIFGLPAPIQNLLLPVKRSTKHGFGDILNLFKDRVHAIYPGTLWCGAGNIANNEEDVGLFKRTDSCCRDHDHCSNNMDAGDEKYRLKNNGIFTRSLCECDEAFYSCLKNANTIVSHKIGATYFNLLRPQCYKNDYPIMGCNTYARLYGNKCIEYDLDLSQNKTWQWFDNPNF